MSWEQVWMASILNDENIGINILEVKDNTKDPSFLGLRNIFDTNSASSWELLTMIPFCRNLDICALTFTLS